MLQSIRVSITPYILNQDLPAYLADLAQTIVVTDANTSQRLELAALAFKTVVEDLPDEAKTLGIEWWLEWRDRFEGRTEAASALRSRL